MKAIIALALTLTAFASFADCSMREAEENVVVRFSSVPKTATVSDIIITAKPVGKVAKFVFSYKVTTVGRGETFMAGTAVVNSECEITKFEVDAARIFSF